jgi:hypothetical protein
MLHAGPVRSDTLIIKIRRLRALMRALSFLPDRLLSYLEATATGSISISDPLTKPHSWPSCNNYLVSVQPYITTCARRIKLIIIL